MYTCSSIFVCASLYAALSPIISHKPKNSGGGASQIRCSGHLWWNPQQTTATAEKIGTLTVHIALVPVSTNQHSSAPVAYTKTKRIWLSFYGNILGKKEMVRVMHKPPFCHRQPRNQQTVQEVQIINSAQAHKSPTRKNFQNSKKNLKPTQKPRCPNHEYMLAPSKQTVMHKNTDQYN